MILLVDSLVSADVDCLKTEWRLLSDYLEVRHSVAEIPVTGGHSRAGCVGESKREESQ